ncbi:glycosyltransferase family 9 protein [Halobacteriovorax sp. HLS]|uniref:glycosyltransferase family 9 protein n=1 Tax=Halobacteriovorax sp. HLS TaxID=2234000 RepID=UPI000FD745C5|nr:glycosyltransferase family 9 protein [Halobacteriovorax sp. HLS]
MHKILVQSPRTKDEIILSFPFFIKLKEKYPESRIYVIVDSGLEEILELLPFKVEIYPLPQKLNTVAGIHKFAVNVKDIFNIELFFDLALDHKGALTGFSFRARKRIGPLEGVKKFLYTDKIEPRSATTSLDEYFVELLNKSLEEPVEDFFFSVPDLTQNENVINLFSEDKVDFFLLRNTALSFDFWKDILMLMDKGRVVIWDQNNIEQWHMLKSSGNLKVELIIQGEVSGLSFLRDLVIKSEFVLTDDICFAQSTYFYEKRSFLFANEEVQFSNTKYFSNVENIILLENEDPISLMTFGQKKELTVPSQVVDYIYETMNI